MASITFGVCFACLLSLICLVSAAPNTPFASKCLGSPVDLRSSVVGGRATISLPEALMSLKLTVEARRLEREGAQILRLYPVMVDEKKCITQIHNFVHMCYEFSEIHWGGKTDENGSDHSTSGYRYPMEIQHYFHRTNTTHSITALAVGVFVKINLQSHTSSLSPVSRSSVTEQSLGNQTAEFQLQNPLNIFSSPKMLRKGERIRLDLGNLLPKDFRERRFYQYRGSLSGVCTETRDWIVFEDPIVVPHLFLDTIRSVGTSDHPNHFRTYQEYRCLLHSHYSSDVNTCDEISPVTEAINPSNFNEKKNFVAGVRDSLERNEDTTPLDSTDTEIDQTELSISSRSSISPSSDWNSGPKIAGNRNVRSEKNDSAKASSAVSSTVISTETSSLSKSPGDLKPAEVALNVTDPAITTSSSVSSLSPVQTTRLSTTLVPAGQGEGSLGSTSTTASSTVVVQNSVQTSVVVASPAAVVSESPVLPSGKNRSFTSIVVISAPIGRENEFRPHGNSRPSGKPESRAGIGEPELVTARDSIQDIRKDKGNTSVSPPVTASVPSLKPGLAVVLLSIFIIYF